MSGRVNLQDGMGEVGGRYGPEGVRGGSTEMCAQKCVGSHPYLLSVHLLCVLCKNDKSCLDNLF